MADQMLGNNLGIAARGGNTLLATITAEDANTFTVSAADLRNLEMNMNVDIRTRATGTLVANRNITILNTTGVVTYDGADAATTVAEGIYLPGQWAALSSNLNGGASAQAGLDLDTCDTIQKMRVRLTAINSTTYSATELNKLSFNDMRYAIRLNDAAGSI